jgi:hypothetical protein
LLSNGMNVYNKLTKPERLGMSLEGHVENGRIVLDEPAQLPEGAKVRVDVVRNPAASPEKPTLYERLQPFVGILDGLPEDAALNHDHYLYGTPKKT